MEPMAAEIPQRLSVGLIPDGMSEKDLIELKEKLHTLINYLSDNPV